jgi:hypothetical protein
MNTETRPQNQLITGSWFFSKFPPVRETGAFITMDSGFKRRPLAKANRQIILPATEKQRFLPVSM